MTRLWAILLYTMFHTSHQTDAPDSAGTEFILGFTNMTSADPDVLLYITTVKTNTVRVQVTAPMIPWAYISETTFNVSAGVTKQITISANIRMAGTQKDAKSILVTADGEISVFGFDSETESCDFFVVMPTDVLGTDYFVLTHGLDSKQSQVLLVGVNDSTIVDISLGEVFKHTVTYDGVSYSYGQTFTIHLNRFETFCFISLGDLSGTKIVANKIIAVFSGNKKILTGANTAGPDNHIIEQLPAVQKWGKMFITSPIPELATSNLLKIVGSTSKTSLLITCGYGSEVPLTLSRAGEIAEFELTFLEYCKIEANNPILLAQFPLGQRSMMIIPPVEQYGADYTFTTPRYSFGQFDNKLMFIVNEGEKLGLRIDGDILPVSTEYQSVNGADYVVGHIRVSDGTHTVRHISPIVTFGGYLYGTTPEQVYVTAAGSRLAPINTLCTRSSSQAGDGLDNDCDGKIDEELCVSSAVRPEIGDDDQDGRNNEDCAKLATVDGGWSIWDDYGGCSVTCSEDDVPENGTQTRRRTCSNPEPANDGLPCKGSNIEYRSCNTSMTCPKSFIYVIGFTETATDASHVVTIVNIDENEANITVFSKSGLIQAYYLNSSKTIGVPIDISFTVTGSKLSSKAIRVKSNKNVLVYGFNRHLMNIPYMAGFVATENSSFGTLYVAVTANARVGELSNPQILIVPSKSATNVNVTIRLLNGEAGRIQINNVSYVNGDVFDVVMEEFDTLLIQSRYGDLTGTRIQSDKPVIVFSGNKASSSIDDHLVEQLPPVSNWGTKFVSIAPTNAIYKGKIVSLYPDTRVTYTCSSNLTQNSFVIENEGAHKSLQFDSETCSFVSEKPVMIAMFANRNDGNPVGVMTVLSNSNSGNPSSLMLLQPLESVNGNLVFYVPENVDEAELVFSTQTESYEQITIDCETMTGPGVVVDGMISSHRIVGSGLHIVRTNGSTVVLAGYVHGWTGDVPFSYPLVTNSSLVGGTNAILQECGTGKDYYDDDDLGTLTATTEITETLTETIQSTATLTKTIRPTVLLTETIQSTAKLTDMIQPTGLQTETIQSTATLTEIILPTVALTETIQSTAILTDMIQPTGLQTETIQSTTTLTDTIQPTVALTETTRPTTLFIESTQSTPVFMDNSTSACSCTSCGNHSFSNYTIEELHEIIEQLRAELLIQRNTTNSYLRTKISAKDNRPTAKALGCVGCVILVIAGLCILAMDASLMVEFIKNIKRKLCPV